MTAPSQGIICLLTIHGIGFQQAPDDKAGIDGYADPLHAHLKDELGADLSDDPHRDHGAIYVQSSWPTKDNPAVRSVEDGLSRLGSRPDPTSTTVLRDEQLVHDGKRIAHVALVYTPAEETGPDPLATFETALTGLFSFEHYISVRHAVGMLGSDVWAIVHPPKGGSPEQPGNVPRADPVHGPGHVQRLIRHLHPAATPKDAAGAYTVLRTVEDDVAGYVARNLLRERVREFVSEAMLRLTQRGDVSAIVVNSHSQGTVVAFDTLRTAPYEVIGMVPSWFTMGCPLRKYADTLSWGTDVGRIASMKPWTGPTGPVPSWTNVWDRLDPVADPLTPGMGWKRGQAMPTSAGESLFDDVPLDTGIASPHAIDDVLVNNVENVVEPGLRAHDYWNNTKEVVPRLADRLKTLAAQ
ncbi:MAG: hypothetical protein ACREN2_07155 [Candidatus Dormibacteria bacterium]